MMGPVSARILVVDDSPTIRKVVGTILATRDFEPVLASDGEQALALLEEDGIDLVLLDFVMPRMNGYQFCRELRSHPKHKGLPVVLMSAKSDKIRGQFVQQTGAIDAITKPFDARGLIAVVEGALKRQEEGRARPIPDGLSMPEDEPLESLRPSRSLSDDPGLRRFQAAQEFAMALDKVLSPELLRVKGKPSDQSVSAALQRAVTPEALGAFSTLVRALSTGENAREVLAGDIGVISIAEVLQLLDLQQQSGALGVFTRKEEIILYLNKGRVDFASWRGLPDEFLLGRYLVVDGALKREDLNHVLENRAASRRLLGEMLVQLGLVKEEQVHKALVRQTSELVYEVVRWKAGRFSFTVAPDNPIATKAALGLEPGPLMMEGFRRVDEWRQIEGTFDFNEVLFPDPVAIERLDGNTNLTRQERSVLEAINGQRTIREILGEMEGGSFELCKIMFQFLNSRLVRRRAG